MFNIVLVEPEIPQNTGNIARTCSVTGCALRLVKPYGFEINDKHLKRAGLDYWDKLDLKEYENYEEFDEKLKKENGRAFYLSTHAQKSYDQVEFKKGDYLIFGKETAGLGQKIIKENYDNCLRIPMHKDFRSLNLSNAVAIVVYEALRQNNFKDMF